MKISDKQIAFINTHFNEGIPENEVEESKFWELKTSEELHYLATGHNWDNGVKVLKWIVESPLCSEATALTLFWLAQPQDYQQYKLDTVLKDVYHNEVFTLLKTILQNYSNSFYQHSGIRFDPTPFCESTFPIPDWIYQKTNGEDSYIYYEADEVEDWLEVDWRNNVNRAESAIDLFNIAYFMNEPESATLILQHPLCDKGIAVLVFWRLYTECAVYSDNNEKLNAIISDIKNNVYAEVLSYDPTNDEKSITTRKRSFGRYQKH
ncbi:DUF4274 domain-containing protein [Sphingobacterium sp. E70]|uniref:DUF4274 domain-containing protein n=1 Tax=Sphingobacterium sp. E70 TaxID=2853439 RepID=UPI00211CFBB4|nr:DUF4274 domain-containing protein [Sphingobacterium sp. E70]ULT24962.1 DUF4274 domain-containing protein [Sphingobacterium sp. E70]